MPAYHYERVDVFRSRSNPDREPYVVQLRVDTRIGDPLERTEQAILTCDCSGWCKRVQADGSRSCRHTKKCAPYLERWKRSRREQLRSSRDASPVLDDLAREAREEMQALADAFL